MNASAAPLTTPALSPTTVAMVTLGCARNEVDSEELAGRLEAGGFRLVEDPADAETVVVNTCGFVEAAKKDSVETLLAAADLKGTDGAQSTTKAVVAVGCLAERYGAELATSLPEADAVLGFDDYPDIAARLRSGGYFVKPVVNVEVTQFVSSSVTVFGEVGTPGIYPLDLQLTVGMTLARAGGTRGTSADFAILKRDGDPVEHRILLSDLSGEWSAATLLEAKDTLFVPVAPVVYIYGQVNSPGSFALKTGMTVRQALARAGGPTLAGSTRNVTIFRDGEKLKKVDLDGELKAEDSVFINEKWL